MGFDSTSTINLNLYFQILPEISGCSLVYSYSNQSASTVTYIPIVGDMITFTSGSPIEESYFYEITFRAQIDGFPAIQNEDMIKVNVQRCGTTTFNPYTQPNVFYDKSLGNFEMLYPAEMAVTSASSDPLCNRIDYTLMQVDQAGQLVQLPVEVFGDIYGIYVDTASLVEGAYRIRITGRVDIINLTLTSDFTIYNRLPCTVTSLTPPSAMSDIEYLVSPDSFLQSYQLVAISQTYDTHDCDSYGQQLRLVSDNTIVGFPIIITQNYDHLTSTINVVIATNDIPIQSLAVKIVAYYTATEYVESPPFLLIFTPCVDGHITSSIISDYTYNIDTPIVDLFNLTTWQGHPHCPLDFTLIFPNELTTPYIEESIISIISEFLSVQTSDYSLGGQQVEVIAKGALRSDSTIFKESAFLVTFNACPSTGLVITTTPITPKSFAIRTSTSFNFASWGSSITGCDAFTYTAIQSNGYSLPTWLTFSSASRQFSLTSATATTSPLSIRVSGAITGTSFQDETFFTIQVTSPCSGAVVAFTDAATSFDYIVNGGTAERYFPTHTVTPSGCTIVYFLLQADGTSLDGDLSSVISLEPYVDEYRMTISTNSNLKAGAHALRVQIQARDNPTSIDFEPFTFTLIKSCLITLSGWAQNGANFTVIPSWQLLANLVLTTSAYCDLSFAVYDITLVETAVIHIQLVINTVPAYILRIYTTSSTFTYNQNYNYKLVVWEATLPAIKVNKTFDLTYQLDCTTMTLAYSQAINSITYRINDPEINITLNDWVIAPVGCTANIYVTKYTLNGMPFIEITNLMRFNSVTSTLHVYSTDLSMIKEYEVCVIGEISGYTAFSIACLQVEVVDDYQCLPGILKIPYVADKGHTYIVGSQKLNIRIEPFQPTIICPDQIVQYKYQKESNHNNLITFNPQAREIDIFTQNFEKVGNYKVEIQAFISQNLEIIASNSIIIDVQVVMYAENSADNTAPIFTKPIETMNLHADENYIYTLPEIKDDQGDKFIIVLKTPMSFLQLDNNIMIFKPKLGDFGQYQIKILLIDLNKISMQNQYTQTVIISTDEDNPNGITPAVAAFLNMTAQSFTFNGILVNKQKLTGKIKAIVSEIDQYGNVKVFFDQKMKQPANINNLIQYNAINFKLKKSNGTTISIKAKKNKRDLNEIELKYSEHWQITSYEGNFMNIKVNFPDEAIVSDSNKYDRLELKFSERYFFINDDLSKIIDPNYVVSHEVPPQLIDDSATQALQIFAKGASSAMTGAVSVNIFLSIFLGVSLKKLWMLITTLQILVHIPLLSTYLPPNVLMCYQAIVDISNMNIIPKQYMDKILNVFSSKTNSDDEKTSGNFSMMDIFLFSCNVGLVFIFLGIILVVGILIVALRYLLLSDAAITEKTVAIVMAIYVVLMPILSLVLLAKNSKKLKDEQFQGKFGSLYQSMNPDTLAFVLPAIFFFCRRLLMALSIVFLEDWPLLQTAILINGSLFLVVYMIYYKPFVDRSTFFFMLFNELTILCCSYFQLIFNDLLLDPVLRYRVGWFIVGLVLMNVTANYLNLIISLVITICQMLKKKCQKKKAVKEQDSRKSTYQLNQQELIKKDVIISNVDYENEIPPAKKLEQNLQDSSFTSNATNNTISQSEYPFELDRQKVRKIFAQRNKLFRNNMDFAQIEQKQLNIEHEEYDLIKLQRDQNSHKQMLANIRRQQYERTDVFEIPFQKQRIL